jgi:hypothetical protein
MTGKCGDCGGAFDLELLHCGFGDCSYAYCDRCGKTAILSGWDKRWPKGIKLTQAEIPVEMESHLAPCDCGGKFTKGNAPRCPHCGERLSADQAAEHIEAQAPGTKKGWRWQKTWQGLYCIVVNGRSVSDNFR